MSDQPESAPIPPAESPEAEAIAPANAPQADVRSNQLSADEVKARRLFITLLILTAGLVGYYSYRAQVSDPIHLYQGVTIMVLALLPGVLWSRHPTQQFPTFEGFLVTFANSYAIPLLSGQTQLTIYAPEVITSAAWGVILFQVVAIVAFYTMPARPQRGPFWTTQVFSTDIGRYLGYAMVLNSIYVVASTYYDVIPQGLVGPSRAIFFGIGIVVTFIQSLRWGEGTLPHHEKAYFLINLAVQVIVLTATLFMINGISILVLALAGYVVGSKRLPVVACLALFVVFAILHNGKFVMRAKYWEGNAPRHGFADLPAFYTEWFENGLHLSQQEENSEITHKLLERTSLFHMMCLVVDVTPRRQPFLDGETYAVIPAQFVPRFFWPDKPQAHIATTRLGIYYGLQDEETASKTTIGFGVLTEAYANYGFPGLAMLGVLIGCSLRLVRNWTKYSPILSYPGIFTVLLMSWCFATEHTMSIWLSSFYQGCAAVLGSIMIVRSVTR